MAPGFCFVRLAQVDDDMSTETVRDDATAHPYRFGRDRSIAGATPRRVDEPGSAPLRRSAGSSASNKVRDHDVWLISWLPGQGDRIPRSWRVVGSVRGGPGHARGTSSRR